MLNGFISGQRVGPSITVDEVSYESLYLTNDLSATLQAVKGASSDSSSALKIATSKVEVIPASDGANVFEVSKADGTAVLTIDTSTPGGTFTGTWTDLGTVTTVDIDGGTVDGAVIGGASAAAVTATTLDATGNVGFDGGSFVFNESGADLDYRVEASGQANAFFVQGSDGFAGFGTGTPVSPVHVVGTDILDNILVSNSNTDVEKMAGIGFRARNDNNAKAAIYFKSTHSYGRGSLCIAVDNATDWDKVTTADVVMSITKVGAVDVVYDLTAGTIGYNDGGAVTQITDRTTGVTLNTICGAITLVSAAGSATPATFTVTNSTVAATDVILMSQKSGTDLYEIHVTAVAAGSFNVTYWTTGGTTTEQPVFNYAVIKATAD